MKLKFDTILIILLYTINHETQGLNVTLAKQHVVFMYTNIKGRRKVQFICAAVNVVSLKTEYLSKMLNQCVEQLFHNGFKVACVAFDGARENRSFAQEHCSVTAKEIIAPELLRKAASDAIDMRWNQEEIDFDSEEDRKIHESQLHDEMIEIEKHLGNRKIGWKWKEHLIIVVPDPPHVIKKLANSLELREDMTLDKKPMTMDMLYDIWEKCSKDNSGRDIAVSPSKISVRNFKKNALSRMNVKLAAQIFSNTMIWLYKDVLKHSNPEFYKQLTPLVQPLLKFLKLWNDTFDITNSRVGGDDRRVEVYHINKRDHDHVHHLLKTSAFIMRWKLQAKPTEVRGRPTAFLTLESGNDAIDLGLSFAALAALHSETEGGPIICRRIGTDCIENHFSNVRQFGGNSGVTTQTATRAISRSTTVRLVKHSKANHSGKTSWEPSVAGDIRDFMPTKEEKQKYKRPLY